MQYKFSEMPFMAKFFLLGSLIVVSTYSRKSEIKETAGSASVRKLVQTDSIHSYVAPLPSSVGRPQGTILSKPVVVK
jgi:hypothetical protein